MQHINKLFLFLFLLFACSGAKKEHSTAFEPVINDSIATLIIESDMGIPLLVKSNKEMKYVFSDAFLKKRDTIQLTVHTLDLLIVGDNNYHTGALDTILIKPNDTIEALFYQSNVQLAYITNGEKIESNWTKDEILPRNALYQPIDEMKQIISRNSFNPPPPAANEYASEVVKQASAKQLSSFKNQKTNPRELQDLKKETDRYYALINEYYQHVLEKEEHEKNAEKQRFNKSLILWEYYQDLGELYRFSKRNEIRLKMKALCDDNLSMRGTFAPTMLQHYFLSNYIIGNMNNNLEQVYNTIIPNDFPSAEKEMKIRVIDEMIFRKNSREKVMTYIEKYVAQYGNTADIQKLKTQIEYDKQISSDLQLESLSNETLSFEELRKRLKGNILYVDFWASWCSPCRIALPKSKRLYENYKDKKILFIYLALNDEPSDWRKACEKENIHRYSYRITNPKTSTFIDKMGISSIPRYMIFDSTGTLVQSNAPSPETTEIRGILDELLRQ